MYEFDVIKIFWFKVLLTQTNRKSKFQNENGHYNDTNIEYKQNNNRIKFANKEEVEGN